MRGADYSQYNSDDMRRETSPHAWSRPAEDVVVVVRPGNISTCVEQTDSSQLEASAVLETSPHAWSRPTSISSYQTTRKKHLHMRGADNVEDVMVTAEQETSPHAWSRHCVITLYTGAGRNISTCVEQTLQYEWQRLHRQKHLHMRGADALSPEHKELAEETSPHAWSRRTCRSCKIYGNRNISTCVEQTFFRLLAQPFL